MSSSFSSIPIIDLSRATSASDGAGVLEQLREAITSVGFLYVSNHGVPAQVIRDLVDVLPVLFALPDEVKEEVALSNSPHFLGYSRVGAETTAGAEDRREQFEFATELPVRWREGDDDVAGYERLKGPNQVETMQTFFFPDSLADEKEWPPQLPQVRRIVETYIDQLTQLGDRFLQLVAQSLSLPPETFFPFLSEQHRLKLVHYPATAAAASQQGVGPHKDSSGWWTFLLQASPPPVRGLQALNKSGDWIDVPVIPDTFVVNIGQAFEVVTNGACRATTHRVVSGPVDRFSVPFFQGVRGDLTKAQAVGTLRDTFESMRLLAAESHEGSSIDSAFLRGKYDTWGETQLRTKIRSHRDVGRRFYADVYEKYIHD